MLDAKVATHKGGWHAWPWGLLGMAILVFLCLRLMLAGYPVQTGFPGSSGVLLDGGSRILHGQHPHQDFHTPIGFIYLFFVAVCLKLAHGLPHALALLSAGAGLVIGCWAWALGRKRFAPAFAGLVAMTTGLIAASPAFFGYGPLAISYGGHYSRLSWSLLILIILQAAMITKTVSSARWRQFEHLITGVCLGLLAGTKFTFFGAAVGLLMVSWWFSRPSLADLLLIIVGALGTVLSGLWMSGASLIGYLHDCGGVSSTASVGGLILQYRHNLDLLGLSLLVGVAWLLWSDQQVSSEPSLRRSLWEKYILSTTVLALGIVLSATDGIEEASPGISIALLVLVGASRSGGDMTATRATSALIVCAAVFFSWSMRLGIPIVKGPYAAESHQATIDNGPWHQLDFMPNVPAERVRESLVPCIMFPPLCVQDNAWFLYLQAGNDLLRGRVASQERVLSMDYINPFPYMLQLPPPLHDHLYWHFGRNIDKKSAPSARELFTNVEWVMVPRMPILHGSVQPKMELYGAWISQHYVTAGENAWWQCWHIRPAGSAQESVLPSVPSESDHLQSH